MERHRFSGEMQTVPLTKIVPNPWRDMRLYPIDKDQVASLARSIDEHGFFGGVKARLLNGVYQLGCGHHRIEAARATGLQAVEIVVDDIDDDAMLRLMTDENATQSGTKPDAVMNEVAAVTRRLIEIILTPGGFASVEAKHLFEGKLGYEQVRGKLNARLDDPNKDGGIGWLLVLRYLGNGDEKRSLRSKRLVIDAISALKQSGRYDDMVDEALRKHPQPVTDKEPAKGKAIATTKPSKPRRRLLDERCAQVFPNDHQFKAFREAVTTSTAQKAIPVEQQYALAQEIMRVKHDEFSKKQTGAPYIKMMVQTRVQDFMKAQRPIDKEERERYLFEQREARIDAELKSANASVRALISAIAKMIDLADEFPCHPKLGGFSARLDQMKGAIEQLSKALK